MSVKPRRAYPVVGAVAISLALVACSGSTDSSSGVAGASSPSEAVSSANCPPGSDLTDTTHTDSFIMVVNAGDPVPMYSKKEAEAEHPKTGEVMLGGSMSSGDMDQDMDMGSMSSMEMPDQRHLTVRICSTDTDDVITDASPVISITDLTEGGEAMDVPVAVMKGVKAGPEDIHFGNDVSMPSGHRYEVAVGLNGETGTVILTRP